MSTKKNAKARIDPLAEARALNETLLEIEKQLKKLALLYNQYFLGTSKQPPNQLRAQVERILREMTTDTIRNATQRHKFQNLIATYASMQALWAGKLREKEEGRGRKGGSSRVAAFSEKRVSSFLRSSAGKKKLAAAKPGDKKEDAPVEAAAAAQAAEPVAAAAAPPAESAKGQSVEGLWDKIVGYQLSAGQPLTFESPDHLAKFLTVQRSKIEQQTGVKGVQLRVAVENGKLKFKAKMPGEKSQTAPLPGDLLKD